MKLLKRIGLTLAIVFVGIQFIPTKISRSTEVSSGAFEKIFRIPEDVNHVLSVSCYDCHSNNTRYPWYSRVQPVGLFLENHISKGKEELNFSEFGDYSSRKQKSKLKSMISQVEKGEMPLKSYTFIHHDASLSKDDKKTLVGYLNSIQDSLK